jgi:hypothetical protein
MLGRLGAAMSAPVPAGQPLVRLADPPEAPFRAVLDAARVVVAPFATLGVTLLLMGFLLAQREDARDRVLRLAGLQDMPMNRVGALDILAIIGRPSAIWRAGPRGPSGVMARAPTLSWRRPARNAWEPPLSRSALSLLDDDPRMAGKP